MSQRYDDDVAELDDDNDDDVAELDDDNDDDVAELDDDNDDDVAELDDDNDDDVAELDDDNDDDVAELDDDNDDDVAELDDDNDDDVAELDDDNDDDVAELDDDNDDDVAELDDDNDDDVAELDDDNDDDVAELDDDNDDDVAELDDDNEIYSIELIQKTSDRYNIDFDQNGNIIGLQEIRRDGSLKVKSVDDDKNFRLVDGLLVEEEIESDGSIEVTTYRDIDGDGYFTKISKNYLPAADVLPRFAIADEATLIGTFGEDTVLLDDDTLTLGGAGADRFVVREIGLMTVADFTFEEGDRICFDTGLGLKDHAQLAQFVSAVAYDEAIKTLSVHFGDYVSLTIVGITEQQISWDIIEVLS